METYYLVDFENVHNEGIENVPLLTKNDHVHIFYTKNAMNCNLDLILAENVEKKGHKVAEGDQSLDKHLVSYLGYLIGINKENECSFVIVSKDKWYDKIVAFWKEEGILNISRVQKIAGPKQTKKPAAKKTKAKTQTKKTATEKKQDKLSGDSKTELNTFAQHKLKEMGYDDKVYNKVCKILVAHCNDEDDTRNNDIHNDIRKAFSEEIYSKIYEDAKKVIKEYSKNSNMQEVAQS